MASEPFGEPRTVKEAMSRDDWPEWKKAIEHELGALEKYGTWSLVPKPDGVNVVGSCWVFRLKHNACGDIERYRARLVAQGFTQIYGVDFLDTFAPVAKLSSIRVILTLAARFDWELEQMDVKSAYLNGELDETIYMRQPPGFEVRGSKDKVCKLQKTLYGLKQAGRQ